MRKKITLFAFLMIGWHSFSQIINTAPYILTVDQLKQWTTTGATASPDLIATAPLAAKFSAAATQFNPALTSNMKIAYLPDGMNNFGNYYGEQSQFNLFNFTHWSSIDKLVWFGGTASQSIQLPSSPWANAAHKNGVKVYGNVFFAPTAFGGSTATLSAFLEQDINGNFIAIPPMIAMMQYYNFDGWFINQETATNATTAQLMYAFVRNLTAQAEAIGKEIMWYDAILLSGSVGWQNRLTTSNSVFVQRDEDADLSNGYEKRVSSSIFINFAWSGTTLPLASRTKATAIGRSSYDVFTGVDIWPGRNQGNFETSGNIFMGNLHESGTTPVTSLGIFAPNCIYNNSTYTNFNNDPTDVVSFYAAERHLFAGDDSNPATVDATGFKGLSNWIPETSVITSIPFQTDFCTGHGTKKFSLGTQTSSNSWHDMNKQGILPTWQWAFSENNVLTADWDFNDAFSNGNSLKVSGNLPANHPVDLMLYKTKLAITDGIFNFEILYKSADSNDTKMKLLVVFADEVNQKYEFPLNGGIGMGNNWTFGEIQLLPEYSGREIAMIGLRFESTTAVSGYTARMGGIDVYNTVLGIADHHKDNAFITVSYPTTNGVAFNINWPDTERLNFTIYDLRGKLVKSGLIALNQTTNYNLDTNGIASGIYTITFTNPKNVSETKKIIIR